MSTLKLKLSEELISLARRLSDPNDKALLLDGATALEAAHSANSGPLSNRPMSDEEILVAYLKLMARRKDWHGVADAANDLRVLETERDIKR